MGCPWWGTQAGKGLEVHTLPSERERGDQGSEPSPLSIPEGSASSVLASGSHSSGKVLPPDTATHPIPCHSRAASVGPWQWLKAHHLTWLGVKSGGGLQAGEKGRGDIGDIRGALYRARDRRYHSDTPVLKAAPPRRGSRERRDAKAPPNLLPAGESTGGKAWGTSVLSQGT